MLMQSWLCGVHSCWFGSRQVSRATLRRKHGEGLVSAEVLEVRSLLTANIASTLAEPDGENECPENTGQNAAQTTSADEVVSENTVFESVTETWEPAEPVQANPHLDDSCEDGLLEYWFYSDWSPKLQIPTTELTIDPNNDDPGSIVGALPSGAVDPVSFDPEVVYLPPPIDPSDPSNGGEPGGVVGPIAGSNENPDPSNRIDPDEVINAAVQSPLIRLENGVLTVYGTDQADEIDVEIDVNNPDQIIVYTMPYSPDGGGYYNGYWTFERSEVSEIHVFGGEGDDHIVKFGDFGAINAVLDGGSGNDILQGDTHDKLEGGDGDDYFATSDWESVEGEYVSVVNFAEWQEGDAPTTYPVEDDPVDGDPVDGDPVDGDPVDEDETLAGTGKVIQINVHDDAVAVGTVDSAPLEQETFEDTSDDGSTSTSPVEIELDDSGTTEDQESSEDVSEIDLAFTDFVSPL